MKTRNTRQKQLLSDAVEQTDTFFTAETLHESVVRKDSSIGLATVYRFLKDRREKGDLHTYMCEGKRTYSTERKSHCHFVCEETGKVIHFDIDSLDFLKKKIPGTIDSFQIEVRGKCEEHR